MRRRQFIVLLGSTVVTWPFSVRAQRAAKVAVIGFLGLGPASAWAAPVEALRAGLRDLGYVEGGNIVFKWE
jgi:putative ABC transport system substrate-binding protein